MGSVYHFLNIWQNYSYPDYKVNMIHKWISFLNLGPIPKYAKYNSLKNNYEILLIENLGYHLCGMMTPTSQRPAHLSLTKVFTRCPVLFSEPFLISSLIPPSLPLFYNAPYFILGGGLNSGPPVLTPQILGLQAQVTTSHFLNCCWEVPHRFFGA